MRTMVLSVFVLATVTISGNTLAADELIPELLIWTRESDGKKIEAKLVRVADDEKIAVLRMADEKEYEVPVDLLIAADQKKIRNAAAKARIDERLKNFHEKNPEAKQMVRDIIERVKAADEAGNGLFGMTADQLQLYLGEKKPIIVKNDPVFKDHVLFDFEAHNLLIVAGFHDSKSEYFSVRKSKAAESSEFSDEEISFVLGFLGSDDPEWTSYKNSTERFIRSDLATAEVVDQKHGVNLMSGVGQELTLKLK